MADHVHWLVEVDPQFGLHRLVTGRTGRCSRVLRAECAHLRSRLSALWSTSFAGRAPLEQINTYVGEHKNHGEGRCCMLAGRKYRLKLTSEQEAMCVEFATMCRVVWNTALDQRRQAVARWQRGFDRPFCGYHL